MSLAFTILLPSTLPWRICKLVLIISSIIFCELPAFILVLPVTNSGPVMTSTGLSACSAMGEWGLLTMQPVGIPSALQCFKMESTKGVVPLAEKPSTKSFWDKPLSCNCFHPSSKSSSRDSLVCVRHPMPPGKMACI